MAHAPAILQAIKTLIHHLGDNPDRAGLLKTPERVATSLQELCNGYTHDAATLFADACDECDIDNTQPIQLRDIPFYSLCEHHLLPFMGVCHITYIPNGKIYGISRLAKCVDMFAHRLQIQERLTDDIADAIMAHMQPRFVRVEISAEHLCLSLRGVQKSGTQLVTIAERSRAG